MESEVEPRRATRRSRRYTARLILIPIAWGVLLFGAVYPWAYRPLLVMIAAIGVYGWTRATPDEREPVRVFGLALLVIAGLAVAQLVPLPADILIRTSPATDAFLRQYDVAYGMARATGQPVTHPLSIVPALSVRGISFLIALMLFVAGCTAMLPRMSLNRLVGGLAALGLGIALFGIVQKTTFNGLIYWIWKPIYDSSNAFGPFVNRNHFAGWMVMTASLTAGHLCGQLAVQGERKARSWAAWLSSREASRITLIAAALMAMMLSIVWTLSRSGIAAMAIAGTLFALHATTRLGRRGSLGPIAGTSFVLMALVLAVMWRGASDVAEWYGRTGTMEWRVEQWNDTLPIVRDFRWFGTGLNTYAASLLLYPTSHPEVRVIEAHNDYLQVLSEGGVIIAGAGLVAVLLLMRGIRRAFAAPQPADVYWVRVGAALGLVAIGLQEILDFSLQMPGNAVLFTVLIAIALHRASPSSGGRVPQWH